MKKFMKAKAMNSPSKSQFFTPTTLGGMSVNTQIPLPAPVMPSK